MQIKRRNSKLRFYWHGHWKASIGAGEIRLKYRHHVHAWRHYIGDWRHVIDGAGVGRGGSYSMDDDNRKRIILLDRIHRFLLFCALGLLIGMALRLMVGAQ